MVFVPGLSDATVMHAVVVKETTIPVDLDFSEIPVGGIQKRAGSNVVISIPFKGNNEIFFLL